MGFFRRKQTTFEEWNDYKARMDFLDRFHFLQGIRIRNIKRMPPPKGGNF